MKTLTATAPEVPAPSAATQPQSERTGIPTVLLCSLAFLMVTLDALVVVTALPSIHESLGGGPDALQWVVNSYNLTFAAGIVTAAALGDRFGRKRLFIVGLAVFTIASIACALAPTMGWLIGFRAVQGLGGAILAPIGLTLVTGAFRADRRGAAIGLWGGISGIGVAAGPLIGGAVTQGADWHWIFWINVPVGVVAIVGCLLAVPESHGARRRLDLAGMALAAAALATGVDAIAEAPSAGWTAGRTVVLLLVAVVCMAGFLARELTARAPMIPLRLFRRRQFTAANLALACSSASIFSAAYVMSEYFQLGRGNTPLGTGLRFLPWTATPLLVAPLAGALTDRIGARRLAVPGLALQAIGFTAIVLLAGGDRPWAALVIPLIVAGVGISLALPSLPAAAVSAVPAAEIGTASGVVNTVQRFGAVAGTAVIAAVFSAHGSLAGPTQVTDGFRWALATSAFISVVGALVAALIGRHRAAAVEG